MGMEGREVKEGKGEILSFLPLLPFLVFPFA